MQTLCPFFSINNSTRRAEFRFASKRNNKLSQDLGQTKAENLNLGLPQLRKARTLLIISFCLCSLK